MDWKRLINKLLLPPVWVVVLLSIGSGTALTLIFMKHWEQTVPAYFAYVIAFYTLSVVCIFCAKVLPKQLGQLKQKVYDSPLGSRYIHDEGFRTRSTMYLSLYINLLYVLIHVVSWYGNRSWWFVVLAGYYLILAFLWALLAGYVRSNPIGSNMLREWQRARTCALVLLSINLSLSGAVLMILFQNRGFHYPGIMIYVMAMFTFYNTIHAIISIIKGRRQGSPVLGTSKMISLSAALVSILNLETAMFSQFGADFPAQYQHLIIILTGAGVSLAVITLSALLIASATKSTRSHTDGK